MNFSRYLYDRIGLIIINAIIFIAIAFTVGIIGFGFNIIALIFIIWFAPLGSYILLEFLKVRKYYSDLKAVTESLDKKYLVTEVIKEPTFIEGQIIHELLSDCGRSMNEHVREYRLQSEEYRDYIEAWVHEIKTPIASSKLIIENNKDEITNRISQELDKVDGFIEQVLYYSRSTDVSRDYIIKQASLKSLVNNVIRSKSRDFINKRIKLELENLDYTIAIDEKWIEFILNQIIQNSLKYSKKEEGLIKLNGEVLNNCIRLSIFDNGFGISEKDINRVFEKGFTGENGRIFSKSTGMGLYICKKLCDGLGIGISIESKKDEYTKVSLVLPSGGVGKF